MEYSFPHYLLSKQSVDDRALNRHVYETMIRSLPAEPLRIIEVGAGVGAMFTRLMRWGMLKRGEYVAVDGMAENVEFALEWIPRWGAEAGLSVERSGRNQMRVFDQVRDVRLTFERADVFDFIQKNKEKADLLIAHAFLDLLPMPESLRGLLSLTKRLAWLTINFDGMTIFEPQIDARLDEKIERLYHQTMDERAGGGDSRTGRHLFEYLKRSNANILAAGASDWVVCPQNGHYPDDEAYFLHFILRFFKESLGNHPDLEVSEFSAWLEKRERQIESGELVYIAHQMDFLAQV